MAIRTRWRFARALRLGASALTLAALAVACPKREAQQNAPPPAPEKSEAQRAVALYDEGRYEEAKPILEGLEAKGPLTGPLMYRLGFCYGNAGDGQKQSEWMQRALDKLREQAASSNNLEISFFLANAQTNLGHGAEAKATAAAATGQIEKKAWPLPARGLDQFRLGKLYADQGRSEEAIRWYEDALRSFGAEGAAAPGYVRWARRYLSQESFARADYTKAEASYEGIVAGSGASAADFDRLATVRARLGKWDAAAQAWGEAIRLDPGNADRARYCRNLVFLARDLGTLPATAPGGVEWSKPTKEELETILKEQADSARQARAEGPPADAALRDALGQKLRSAEGLFVAAALEYAYRNYDIRETAFVGGYARMIFHPEEWAIPSGDNPQN